MRRKKVGFYFFCYLFLLFEVYGIVLPDGIEVKEKEVFYYPEGNLMSVSFFEPVMIQTPVGKLKFIQVNYYKIGNIESGDLSGAQEIKTPIGNMKVNWKISFYATGKIEKLWIDENNINCKFGNIVASGVVAFYENGNIRSIELYKSQKVKLHIGEPFLKGFMVFYPSGEVKEVDIDVFLETKLNNLGERKIGDFTTFYKNGLIKSTYINTQFEIQTKIGNINIVDDISFYENGNIERCYTNDNIIINTNVGNIKISKRIVFYQNGNLKYATLGNLTVIEGKRYNVGNIIGFSEDGSFIGKFKYLPEENSYVKVE